MQFRLTVKLAEVVNGVHLSRYREGDIVELAARDGQMLIAENWAEEVAESPTHSAWRPNARAMAADRKRARRSR
jgi:hypothetical protein